MEMVVHLDTMAVMVVIATAAATVMVVEVAKVLEVHQDMMDYLDMVEALDMAAHQVMEAEAMAKAADLDMALICRLISGRELCWFYSTTVIHYIFLLL
jgi:hypothetical protein